MNSTLLIVLISGLVTAVCVFASMARAEREIRKIQDERLKAMRWIDHLQENRYRLMCQLMFCHAQKTCRLQVENVALKAALLEMGGTPPDAADWWKKKRN